MRVNFNVFAFDFEVNLFIFAVGGHAHGAVKTSCERSERHHSQTHHAFLQIVGESALPV